jgi:adenylate cyclase class 2
MYEVELKFPLDDTRLVLDQLAELGAAPGEAVEQSDLYFRHPARDFGQTDEALRIRRSGDQNRVTYKGPRVDTRAKTRREVEVAFEQGEAAAESLRELLTAVGFREFATVEKVRTAYQLLWEKRKVVLALDRVDGLGTFLEIETIAEENDREPARDSILRLAQRLGLENCERKSYLCLLREKNRGE